MKGVILFFMSKEYYLNRRNNIWYVRFVNPYTKKLTTAKSTGMESRKEAERKAMEWLVAGNISDRKSEVSMNTSNLINALSISEINKAAAEKLIKLLKDRGFIDSVIFSDSESAEPFIDYLRNFWDYNTSTYIKEKLASNQSIHKAHCKGEASCIELYYVKRFINKSVGSITLNDMIELKHYLLDLDLSFSRINYILRAGTTALKYAFYHEKTKNNCFDGLVFCSTQIEPRQILKLDQAIDVFSSWWENGSCKLANYLAFKTGMRMGEIKALRFCDIKDTYLDVCHSWSQEDGLKETKNNEARRVPIEEPLRQMLLKQVMKNPHNQGVESWVFYGDNPDKPCDSGLWLDHLRIVLKKIGVPNYKDICFHSWRHLFVTTMRGKVPDSELQKITGHKTLQMLDHYSEHQTEQALKVMAEAMAKNFLISSKH